MRFLSVCSGIEAASVAWEPLGWKAIGFSEIKPFPSAVLAYHYPDIPNYGDMTKYREWNINGTVELLCGGTPCQSFSVAGSRKSLSDSRGNVSLVFCQMADYFNPEVVVWENVPGVLSTKDNAFGCFLAELAGCNEIKPALGRHHTFGIVDGSKRTVAFRILDAQYFGVAQRRRRVFVVAFRGSGNWRGAAALFPVGESVYGNTAPRRKTWEKVAETIAACTFTGGAGGRPESAAAEHFHVANCITASRAQRIGDSRGQDNIVPVLAKTLSTSNQRLDYETETFVTTTPTLVSNGDAHSGFRDENGLAVAYGIPGNWIGRAPENGGNSVDPPLNLSPCLTSTDRHGVGKGVQVRRLTPLECERLQGFPDDYTRIPYRNKPADDCPDGPRYEALGNSWAVPVVRWIGKRIEYVRYL